MKVYNGYTKEYFEQDCKILEIGNFKYGVFRSTSDQKWVVVEYMTGKSVNPVLARATDFKTRKSVIDAARMVLATDDAIRLVYLGVANNPLVNL